MRVVPRATIALQYLQDERELTFDLSRFHSCRISSDDVYNLGSRCSSGSASRRRASGRLIPNGKAAVREGRPEEVRGAHKRIERAWRSLEGEEGFRSRPPGTGGLRPSGPPTWGGGLALPRPPAPPPPAPASREKWGVLPRRARGAALAVFLIIPPKPGRLYCRSLCAIPPCLAFCAASAPQGVTTTNEVKISCMSSRTSGAARLALCKARPSFRVSFSPSPAPMRERGFHVMRFSFCLAL